MKSSLRTSLPLLLTLVWSLAMAAQSPQQEQMNSMSQSRMESAGPEKPAMNSCHDMKMKQQDEAADMKKGKTGKNKARKMKKDQDKKDLNSGFSIYG
jgi:uncharacterized protein (DUF305 family)